MFGHNVDLSGDGSKMVVGSPRINYTTLYQFSNNEYKVANTINFGEASANFGIKLKLSEDGNCLIVGAPNSSTTLGAIRIYDTSNIAAPVTLVSASGITGEYRGTEVSIAGRNDANGYLVATVGRAGANTLVIYQGNTTGMSQRSITTVANSANAVAISADMTFIAVGGTDESVRIYDNTGTNLLHTITAFDGAPGRNFGDHISLNRYNSTNYLMVSASGKDDPVIGLDVGSVYVYSSTNATNWSYVTEIIPAESANSLMGIYTAGVMCSNSSVPTFVTSSIGQKAGQQNGVVYITTSSTDFETFSTQRVNNIPTYASPISAMAMSADGNIVALGMANDSSLDATSQHGSIALYEKINGQLINTQRFYGNGGGFATAGATNRAYHGAVIAINGNGSVIAVGNPNRDANATILKTGGITVHTKAANGTWFNSSNSIFSNTTATYANAQMGWSVAVSNSGKFIVGGAPYAAYGNTGGLIHWGHRSDASWSGGTPANTGSLYVNTWPGDGYGWSVSMSESMALQNPDNYQLLAVGAPFASSRTGSANTQEGYVAIARINLSVNNATHLAQLRSNDIAAGDQFGYSVALSPDGTVLAVGAPGRDDNQSGAGVVYVFTNDGNEVFSQSAKIQAAEPALNDRFGTYVTMSNSNTIYVGAASVDAHGRTDSGAAYKFTKSGGTWAQTAKFISNNAAFAHDGANFGSIIASTSDDTQLVILAPNDKASSTGSAYLFTQTL